MSVRSLPIFELEPALLRAFRETPERRRFVVEAPTGSGKSTQIPQMLLANGLLNGGEVVILQPRRIAARMLARRVAEEMGVRLGDEVGYQVRFESVVSRRTVIRYVTEGILLRRMLEDPGLDGVAAVVFDEFHERHLYGDITLARALDLQESLRPDLSLFVMSATLQTQELKRYLHPCVHLTSEGRTFPVEIRYAPPRQAAGLDLPGHAARICAETMTRHPDGHALIFMPGAFEIRKTMEALGREKSLRDCDILPLHGELPSAEQDAAVAPGRRRRIVVATNVAETSLTIDGVQVVIDAGQARLAAHDPNRGINTLTIQPVSRASADQRAGRAGRTGPGVCVRLWSEEQHGRRPAAETPEVQRLDLAEVVLGLHAAGVTDLSTFRWFEPPDPRSLALAEELIRQLGAVDADGGTITELGRRLTAYPVHPRQARVLEEAVHRQCVLPVALCIALLQGRSLFVKSQGGTASRFQHPDDRSDFLPLLRAWRAAQDAGFRPDSCGQLGINGRAAFEAARLAERLVQLTGSSENSEALPEQEVFAKVMLAGYSDQVARRTNVASTACDVAGGRRGSVARESIVRGTELLVAAEIAEIQGRDVQVVLNLNTEIEESWLAEMFPGEFHRGASAVWDAQQRRVMQKEQVCFRDLVLRERQSGEPDQGLAAGILADKVMAGELVYTPWDDSVQQWLARLEFLRQAMPELELPLFTDDDKRLVLEQSFFGCKTYKDIKELSPWPVLRGWLSGAQSHLLDRHAPERIGLAGGRKVKIDYVRGSEPTVSAFIQHLYGQKETPRIAAGRVPLLIQALAPNHRPIQVTKDLASFWKNSYPQIARELKRRYPKHEWREEV
ncbi:MAG: ATP-dependent helicase HrpB [Verrucomicrobiales bacterium]|nr:ATP-dependent helicase HrpB [Verrucomicrobiales bacterium]